MRPKYKSPSTLFSRLATALLVAGGLSVSVANAATFQYRHSIMGLVASSTPQAQEAAAEILVALTGGPALPPGEVNWPYSYDLKQLLSVTGETGYNASSVSWELQSGQLPAGLSLGADGVISGKPTTKDAVGGSFQVKATYKTKTGQQAYTIVVNGAVLHVTQIAAGVGHTCAVTTVGGVKCWGMNTNGLHGVSGLLGDGTTTAVRLTPVDVVGLTSGVTRVSIGYRHTCAVTSAGSLKCWGDNGVGTLGDGTTINRATPVTAIGLTGVVDVAASSSHTCAVTILGALKCWGYNAQGQLGDGTTNTRISPVGAPTILEGVTSLSAGSGHTCAVTTDGGAKCWGGGGYGQLGNNGTYNSSVPVQVSGLTSGVLSVAAGYTHTCAVMANGGVACWGDNSSGQLGDNSTTLRKTPVAVSGLTSGVSSLTAGQSSTCAVTTEGAAKCWGTNSNGQLGDGSVITRKTPVAVSGLTSGVLGIVAANGGGYHTCALTTDGPKCWGLNDQGQLGDGSLITRTTPTAVKP